MSTCKTLDAFEKGKFKPGDNWDPDWMVFMVEDLTPEQCFDILVRYTAAEGYPSFLLFNNFCKYMSHCFQGMAGYPIFQGFVLREMEGLQAFRHVFVNLLTETCKDFALRAVPVEVPLGAGGGGGGGAGGAGGGGGGPPPPAPMLRTLSKQRSIGLMDEGLRVPSVPDNVELVRAHSDNVAERFQHMKTWEDTEHPIALFYYDQRGQSVDGLDVICLNPRFLDQYVDAGVKGALQGNNIEFGRDWKDLTSEDGVEIVRKVEGFAMNQVSRKVDPVDATYVITIDNLLKMLSISFRLKYGLPVIIMGETGCGKSSLIRQLASIIRAPLYTLNIHGGMEDTDILRWMDECCVEANRFRNERILVFLDEVNTTNCMGLFKEIICDHTCNGRYLPDNMLIVSALNPYRLKKGVGAKEEKMAGLVFEHHEHGQENVGTGIKDPLKDLVYRVHPLPESMIDHVFDFGALAPETEKLYIKAMIKRQLAMYCSEDEFEQVEQKQSDIQMRQAIAQAVQGAVQQAKQDGMEDAAIEERAKQVADQVRQQMEQHEAAAQAQRDAAAEAGVQAEAAMVKTKFNRMTDFGEFVEIFAEMICASQEFVRTVHGGERSVVSLRDVARCVKIYRWFGEHFSKNATTWTRDDFFGVKGRGARRSVRKAVILSLAYCYHARLPREERRQYRVHLGECYDHIQKKPDPYQARMRNLYGGYGGWLYGGVNKDWDRPRVARCSWLELDARSFQSTLENTQKAFVSQMKLPDGIALNEALCENLFMILVSILNLIPIFVIGKPGSSKSLAMGLIQQNLNGDASENEFLRSLPAVEVFSYQCSPLSTSQGIEQAFEAAGRYKKEAPDTTVVVLLDEVGLAEQSPHLPLKVLHKVLDEGVESAVVGISNWSLDPAKMNRAVHLYRPAPTVGDLSVTAEGMVRSANLKGYLQSIAKAYSAVYHQQIQEDFWGLREFYSTVRHINRALQVQGATLDSQVLMEAVLRNFGGRPAEMEKILGFFFSQIGLNRHNAAILPVMDLVRQNLHSREARHIMLLTKNNAALGLLFDNGILSHKNAKVLFGSDFPLDQTDLQICLNIQRIKNCMAEGITIVLVHCDQLYESLYDLLNQHYTEYGGQLYVRLAYGSHSRLCPIHRDFRVIVVVDIVDAYNRLAPPLLNRFEKQVLERKDVLTDAHRQLATRVASFASLLATGKDREIGEKAAGMRELKNTFCGFHSDMMSSLCSSVFHDEAADEAAATEGAAEGAEGGERGEGKEAPPVVALAAQDSTASDASGGGGGAIQDMEAKFQDAVQRLLWVATPESICRAMKAERDAGAGADVRGGGGGAPVDGGIAKVLSLVRDQHGVDVADVFFQQQVHGDLPNFVETQLEDPSWADKLGSQVMALTYSPLQFRLKEMLLEHAGSGWNTVDTVTLHELSAERDLIQRVEAFFEDATDGSLLVLQCDPLAASLRRIEHAKYLVENARAQFLKKLEKDDRLRTDSSSASLADPNKIGVGDGFVRRGGAGVGGGGAGADAGGVAADAAGGAEGGVLGEAAAGAAEGGDGGEGKGGGDEEDGEGGEGKGAAEDEGAGAPRARKGVHVMLVLHLPRNDLKYCFDFDLRWRYAFIDSVQPGASSGLPSISHMLGASMLEIVNQLDLRQVLLQVFRRSMARLVYNHERTNEDVRGQITHILRNLQDKESRFVEIAQGIVTELVEQDDSKVDLVSEALKERELALAGTFQNACHRQINETVSTCFAVLLSHVDRNAGLGLAQDPEMSMYWEYLCLRSFKDLNVARTSRRGGGHGQQHIAVSTDGAGGRPFTARFPFSFYIFRIIEGSRVELINRKGDTATMLQQQVERLGFEHGIDGVLPVSVVRRYAYDFACMALAPVEGIDRQAQADHVWDALTLYGHGKAPVRLSDVHARWWRCERTVHAYMDLIDGVPSARPVLVGLCQTQDSFGWATDMGAVDAVTAALAPSNLKWTRFEDYDEWMSMVESCREGVSALLDGEVARTRVDVNGSEADGGGGGGGGGGGDDDSGDGEGKEGKEGMEGKGSEGDEVSEGKESKADHGASAAETTAARAAAAKKDAASEAAAKALLEARAEEWEKVLFFYTFVRDVFVALQLPAGDALKTITSMDLGAGLRNRRTFRGIVRLIKELVGGCRGKEASLQAQASRFMDSFIFDFCFANEGEAAAVGHWQSIEWELLEDFISLLAGRTPGSDEAEQAHGQDGFRQEQYFKYFIDVVPSEAGRVALLRALLALSEPATAARIEGGLLEELSVSIKEAGHADTPLAVSFESVLEEADAADENPLAALTNDGCAAAVAHLRMLQDPAQLGDGVTARDVLVTLGKVRRVVTMLAAGICEGVDLEDDAAGGEAKQAQGGESKADGGSGGAGGGRGGAVTVESLIAMQALLEPLFKASSVGDGVRSVRTFLLKLLERKRGLSFVRSALQQEPLVSSRWLAQWKETGETGLVRFLGDNKLPRHNPLTAVPLFTEADQVLSAVLNTGDATPLDRFVSEVLDGATEALAAGEVPPTTRDARTGQLRAALLAALFHEVYLLRVLPEIPPTMVGRLESLRAWLRTSRTLDAVYSPREREVVRFFAETTVQEPKFYAEGGRAAANLLSLHARSSPERIAMVRVVVHSLCVAMAAPADGIGRFFQVCLSDPRAFKGSLMPTMPEDALAMAAKVMGGRWYRCCNGHAYYVDACGRPTIVQKCAECGVDIGGTDHNPLPGQQDIGNVGGEYYKSSVIEDKSDPGYCVRSVKDESSAFDTVRSLNPTAVRAVRFFMHAALVAGSAAGDEAWGKEVGEMLNDDYCKSDDSVNMAQYFSEHLSNDWNVLTKEVISRSADDVAMTLHLILHSVQAGDAGSSPAPLNAGGVGGIAAPPADGAVPPPPRGLEGGIEGMRAQLLGLRQGLRAQLQAGAAAGAAGVAAAAAAAGAADAAGAAGAAGAAARVPTPPVFAKDGGLRTRWENEFFTKHVKDITDDATLAERLEKAFAQFSSSDDDSALFTAELAEKYDVDGLDIAARKAQVPLLWRFRRPFSLGDFKSELKRDPEAGEE